MIFYFRKKNGEALV